MSHSPPRPPLPRATGLAHQLVKERLKPGDTAIDATVGNGHDTLFLAACVGSTGQVIGFDIQEEAIQRVAEKAVGLKQILLHTACHAGMSAYATAPVAAVMFNLGYLPSGDKTITTQPDSTLAALEAASQLLSDGGLITLALYTGHDGGAAEAQAVEQWAASLPQESFAVAKYQFLNQRNAPPFLIAIGKRPSC